MLLDLGISDICIGKRSKKISFALANNIRHTMGWAKSIVSFKSSSGSFYMKWEINSRKVSCNLTLDSPPPAFSRVMREQQEWTCLPLGSSHCQSKKKSKSPDHLYHQRVRRGYLTSSANPIFNCIQSSLGSVFCQHWVCMHMYLQASLVSLPLSMLPGWLQLLEPLSGLPSCCWCSGRRSKALRRQIAANSILATGIAADWPSLHTNTGLPIHFSMEVHQEDFLIRWKPKRCDTHLYGVTWYLWMLLLQQDDIFWRDSDITANLKSSYTPQISHTISHSYFSNTINN